MDDRLNKLIPFCLLSLFVFLLSACVELDPPPPPPEVPAAESGHLIYIGIETSLDQQLRPILANHTAEAADPADELQVFISGSRADLLDQLKSGELDSVFIYQKPADNQLWASPVALDSITVITHPAITLNSGGLNRPQLQQIFTADIKDWGSFSPSTQAIALFVFDHASGLHTLFNERVLENRPPGVSAVVAAHPHDMLETVAETEGSIGLLPTSALDPAGNQVQPIPIDGSFAQFSSVRSQQYPLTVPVYMVAPAEPQGELRRLAAWLQSDRGQQLLSTKFVQIGN